MRYLQITALTTSLSVLAVTVFAQGVEKKPLTIDEAIAIALAAQPGTVAEAEPDQFEGRPVIDIEIVNDAGQEVEFKVDVETGEILNQWVDDDPSDDPVSSNVQSGQASAEPYIERSIPLDWALAAATAAQEACSDLGFATTVTVVDQRALPRVQLMREGAFPHTIHTSSRKAITAASRREATAVIEAENEHEPTLGAVFNEIGLITLSGGIPIVYQGKVIGGIGIAGSPGEDPTGKEFDDICAEAGIAAISEKLN
ncbi:heme-binding protein [Ruegeria sp. R14_0]|uniref:heme-binding protein n=1 Tax=Ruegeria sp. R14_0 TaxID=2821100 RepID=UPI001ADA3B7E|nr:heme-binding protein [Ruegeria sp. R14_0]MBO9448342.1 heme-binding protein [Ruegeria sp. R14_0]